MPNEAPPTAPPAPAAPPAAPTPPPPATPTAPAPPPAAGTPSAPENPFAELEAAVKAHDKPPEVTKGKEPTAPAAPTAPTKPAEPSKPSEPARPAGPKELRIELERARKEAQEASTSLQALQAKIKDYESRGKDTEALVARQTALEKELADARAEVRAIKQEASPEFIKQYKKPFDDAAAYAKHIVEQLTVLDENGDPTRQAKFEDLQQLYNMPINKASAVARTMFGDDSQTVINHLNELHRLDYVYQNALTEERANAAQRAKEEEGKSVVAREQLSKAYIQINKELAESVEDYRDPPDDKEAAEMRQKGYAIFDQKPENTEKAVIKQAHVRQMVASFFPMKLTITRLKKENEELKSKLASEHQTDPGKTKRPGGSPAPTDENLSWEQAARKELL